MGTENQGVITIQTNTRLTKLNSRINFNPLVDTPSVTVFSNTDIENTYTVYATVFIPAGKLTKKPVSKYIKKYSNHDGKEFTPSLVIPLKGDKKKATIVLGYFKDIAEAQVLNNQGEELDVTTRSFAVMYDYNNQNNEPFLCDVYALEFQYTVNDASNYESVYLAHADFDPELSRGTVTGNIAP